MALAVLLWFSKTILLLVFAGCVGAVLLSTLIAAVQRWCGIRRGLAFAAVLLAAALGAALILWASGPAVARQAADLRSDLPAAAARVFSSVQDKPWGRWLIAQSVDGDKVSRAVSIAAARLGGAMTTTASALAGLLLIFLTTIYLAAEPEFYRRGLHRILPPDSRQAVDSALIGAIRNVRFWLLAKLVSMLVIGSFVALGLWALQIPLAGLLGAIAGLLTFIPNLGPILSVLPAAVLGFSISPVKGLLTIAIFLLAHFLEGNLVTPLAERAIVKLPPFLTLSVQLILGSLTGPLGIALAAPVTAALIGAWKTFLPPAVSADSTELDQPNRATTLSKRMDKASATAVRNR